MPVLICWTVARRPPFQMRVRFRWDVDHVPGSFQVAPAAQVNTWPLGALRVAVAFQPGGQESPARATFVPVAKTKARRPRAAQRPIVVPFVKGAVSGRTLPGGAAFP